MHTRFTVIYVSRESSDRSLRHRMDLTKTKTNERRYTSTNILHATADKTIQMNTSIYSPYIFGNNIRRGGCFCSILERLPALYSSLGFMLMNNSWELTNQIGRPHRIFTYFTDKTKIFLTISIWSAHNIHTRRTS